MNCATYQPPEEKPFTANSVDQFRIEKVSNGGPGIIYTEKQYGTPPCNSQGFVQYYLVDTYISQWSSSIATGWKLA